MRLSPVIKLKLKARMSHDSVAVCRIYSYCKRLKGEGGMCTYERLGGYCIAELKSVNLEGVKARSIVEDGPA